MVAFVPSQALACVLRQEAVAIAVVQERRLHTYKLFMHDAVLRNIIARKGLDFLCICNAYCRAIN